MYIALEGIDGAGTTTQTARLAETLRGRDLFPVMTCAEPSDGPIGKLIRERLLTMEDPHEVALLFAADRRARRRRLEQMLQAGDTLVSDRCVLSSLVYQSLDCDPQWVRTINAYALWPDLVIVLDVNADIALERIAERKQRDVFEQRPLLERACAVYRSIAQSLTPPLGCRCIRLVDGAGKPPDVAERVLSVVDAWVHSNVKKERP